MYLTDSQEIVLILWQYLMLHYIKKKKNCEPEHKFPYPVLNLQGGPPDQKGLLRTLCSSTCTQDMLQKSGNVLNSNHFVLKYLFIFEDLM